MELRVNDYVRTKNGLIAKIININDFREPSLKYGIEANYIVDIGFIGDEDIKISSSNIIDLIEINDILSFKDNSIARIQEINGKYYLLKDYSGEQYYEKDEWLFDDLKSIVTHEQFESMEYKVGD